MKNTIKNTVSIISLTVLINGVTVAGEQDYGSDIYRDSIVYHADTSFSNDISDEVDAFTLNSSTYEIVAPQKTSMTKELNIPTNTVFGDPLYYSSNK